MNDLSVLRASPLDDMPRRDYIFANESARKENDNLAAYGNYSLGTWKSWGNPEQGGDGTAGVRYTLDD